MPLYWYYPMPFVVAFEHPRFQSMYRVPFWLDSPACGWCWLHNRTGDKPVMPVSYTHLDVYKRQDLGEDEICDIALYLGASLERERAMRNRQSPVVTIVCGSGIGTSQFFEAKLGRIFPEIQVRKIVPRSRARYCLLYTSSTGEKSICFTGRSPLTYASSGALSAMRWVI